MTKTKLIFVTAFSLLTIARAIDAYQDTQSSSSEALPSKAQNPVPSEVTKLTPPLALMPEATNVELAVPPKAKPGRSDISFGQLISVRARASHRFVPDNQNSDIFMQIDLDGAGKSSGKRPRLAVAVVIDRSGSMDGEKMRHTKNATKHLIDKLNADDHVAIVSYSNLDQVDLHLTKIEDIGRESIGSIVDQLYPAGGTNLSAGLKQAIALLSRSDDSSLIKRVVIMSDGNANAGITSSRRLSDIVRRSRAKGISVTSMGVGLDFNEDLMTALADHGGGKYHFVEDAFSIKKAMARELKGLSEVIARQLVLKLELPKNVRAETIYGFPIDRSGNTISIPIGDISRGEHRQVVAKLKVISKSAGLLPLGKVRLNYTPMKTRKIKSLAKAISIAATTHQGQLANAEVPAVAETANAAFISQLRIEAAQDYARGDQISAKRKMKQGIKQSRSAGARLKSRTLSELSNELSSNMGLMQNIAPESAEGKSYIKNEKNTARMMQVY